MQPPAEWPSGARIVPQDVDVSERLDAAHHSRLHALHVVDVAENTGDALRLVAAGIAHGVADEIDRPTFQMLRRLGRQGQRSGSFAVVLDRLHLEERHVIAIVNAQHALDSVGGGRGPLIIDLVIHPGR